MSESPMDMSGMGSMPGMDMPGMDMGGGATTAPRSAGGAALFGAGTAEMAESSFFEIASTLITFILLGQFLEVRSSASRLALV
jgi:cation transport ATPase